MLGSGGAEIHAQIKVCARIRPLAQNSDESLAAWGLERRGTTDVLTLQDDARGPKEVALDHIFTPETRNAELYSSIGRGIVDGVMRGYNGTLLAYGQTGSGKTHTVMGGEDADADGLLAMAVADVFARMKEEQTSSTFLARMAYMEVYNEKIFDLLAPAPAGPVTVQESKDSGVDADASAGEEGTREPLKIVREDDVLGVVIENLQEVVVDSQQAVLEQLAAGEKLRHYRSTNMNERSSRSHTIFRLVIESSSRGGARDDGKLKHRNSGSAECLDEDVENESAIPTSWMRTAGSVAGEQVSVSCLSVVDLAGSERQSNAGTSGTALKEGSNINKSLLALREVIASLAKRQQRDAKNKSKSKSKNGNGNGNGNGEGDGDGTETGNGIGFGTDHGFVPYRNSKLTRILRQALGGNALTCLVCTISPSQRHEGESVNTLQFGAMCKTVKNTALKNELGAGGGALLEQYRAKLRSLESELQAQKAHAALAQKELEDTLAQAEEDKDKDKDDDDDDDDKEDDEEDEKLGSQEASGVERVVIKAQHWFRKAEVARIKALRAQSEEQSRRTLELEEELARAKAGQSGMAYVLQCRGTADNVLKFAQTLQRKSKKNGRPSSSTSSSSSSSSSTSTSSSSSSSSSRQARLRQLEKWEAEMKHWYDSSLEYNDETEERAGLVECEAAKIDELRSELEAEFGALDAAQKAQTAAGNRAAASKEDALRRRTMSVAAREIKAKLRDEALAKREADLECRIREHQAKVDEALHYEHHDPQDDCIEDGECDEHNEHDESDERDESDEHCENDLREERNSREEDEVAGGDVHVQHDDHEYREEGDDAKQDSDTADNDNDSDDDERVEDEEEGGLQHQKQQQQQPQQQQQHQQQHGHGGSPRRRRTRSNSIQDVDEILCGLAHMSTLSSSLASRTSRADHHYRDLVYLMGEIIKASTPLLAPPTNFKGATGAQATGAAAAAQATAATFQRKLLRRHLADAKRLLLSSLATNDASQ